MTTQQTAKEKTMEKVYEKTWLETGELLTTLGSLLYAEQATR